MHKNRFLFLVHACTLVFAFCACGSTPGQLPEEITKPGEQISQEENTPTEDLQGKITLFDIETEYDTNIRLCYPNFAELSVGEIYNSNDGHFYILFDSDGVVRYITEDYIQSGFYDGMCKHSPKYMMDETGRLFRPQYLQDDEEIIRYAKDDFGVVLWTAKKVDSLEGSKTILTAWTSDGEVLAQFDCSQEMFTKSSASALYKALMDDSQGFAYQGGYTYRIKDSINYYFLDIDTKQIHYIVEGGMFPSVRSDGTYHLKNINSNFYRTTLMDNEWNALPGFDSMIYRGPGDPILSEGLIYLDDGNEHPSGFYDPYLNLTIDLSQYNVRPISNYQLCPRFANGYAVLQLNNSDNVPFWGVMNKEGVWTVEPQKGTVNFVVPFGDGLLINVLPDEGTTNYLTFTEDGKSLGDEWNCVHFLADYEVVDEYLYMMIDDGNYNPSQLIKAQRDGSYTYLS